MYFEQVVHLEINVIVWLVQYTAATDLGNSTGHLAQTRRKMQCPYLVQCCPSDSPVELPLPNEFSV